VFRFAWWTLRQARYATLATLMVFVAAGCTAAGIWQVQRFESKVHDNDTLNANYRRAVAPFQELAVPLAGHGRPSTEALRFRSVTVTGHYDPTAQQYLDKQSDANGDGGFYVLTPLRIQGGTLLVVRGFVAASPDGLPAAAAAPAPSGTVQLTGRLEAVSTSSDHAGRTAGPYAVITTVNPIRQAARMGSAVYDTELQLDAGQPGSAGLVAIPKPDLSNPAGGAYDWQHFAYVIQWFLFAVLALAAPFAVGRSELREARRNFLGLDDEAGEFGEDSADFGVAALAAGTGSTARGSRSRPDSRLVLSAGGDPPGVEVSGVEVSGVEVSVRASGELAIADQQASVRLQQAEALADRYGRSLGTGLGLTGRLTRRPRRSATPAEEPYQLPDSKSEAPRRSPDGYHGSYNDYLWELAVADGDVPRPTEGTDTDRTEPRAIKIIRPVSEPTNE
jgi:cytochrome oxidase assembly protein ShyY1